MKLGLKILRGSALLSSGQIVSYGAAFARTVILARVLDKSQFGIIAILELVVAILDFSGKMSIGQQLIQSRDGDDPEFQAAAHLSLFACGAFGALLMLAFAVPASYAFKLPAKSGIFLLISVVGVLRGLQHLDAIRKTRQFSYSRAILIDIIPQIVSTLAALPLALWLKDYRAAVCLLIGRVALSMVLSHVVAERKYRWKFEWKFTKQIITFGWPLLLNAWLLFGLQRGDQAMLGATYDKADLAQYAAAALLAFEPGMLFMQVFNQLMLPTLSQVQNNHEEFHRRYAVCAEVATIMGTTFACFLIVGGEAVTVLTYGAKYRGCGAIIGWLAAANAFRLIRTAPALAAMAQGDTVANLLANVFRSSGLILAIVAIFFHEPLRWVAACGCVGELPALVVCWYRLKQRTDIPYSMGIRCAVTSALLMASAGALAVGGATRAAWPIVLLLCVIACGFGLVIMWRAFSQTRTHGREILVLAPLPRPISRVLAWCGVI